MTEMDMSQPYGRPRTTQEVLAIHQPKEVLISLERGLVCQLCDILERHPH